MKSSGSTANDSVSSSLITMYRLIEANDWQKLQNMFLTKREDAATFQRLAAIVARSRAFHGMTVLHACARFDPPASVVSKIIKLCPNAPSSQDCLKRTPLHVAAGCGASSSVIELLANAYPDACTIQDQDGRTPLHMACDSSCELFEEDRGRVRRGAPSYATINALLMVSLDAAVLEDEDGMSALEHALFSDANLRTVKLIQKAAQKVM